MPSPRYSKKKTKSFGLRPAKRITMDLDELPEEIDDEDWEKMKLAEEKRKKRREYQQARHLQKEAGRQRRRLRREHVAKLHAQGLMNSKIAAAVGISETMVIRDLRVLNL